MGFFVALAGACSADPPTREETDGVITVQTDDYQGSRYATFALNDELDELCVQSDAEPTSADDAGCSRVFHDNDAEVLEHLAESMKDLGFEQLPTSEAKDADLYLIAGLVATDFWDLSEDFCIDNGSIEGCLESITQHEIFTPTGSLILVLVDQGASDDGALQAVWTASIDQRWAAGASFASSAGGAGGGGSSADIELEPWLLGIDQAFEQSPYLRNKEAN